MTLDPADSPTQRVRSAVELAGGQLRTRTEALLAAMEGMTGESAELALAEVGVSVDPSIVESAEEGFVVLSIQASTALHDSGGNGDAPPSGAGDQQEFDPEAVPDGTPLGRDLTYIAGAGGLDPVIGREREIAQVAEVLSRKLRRGVALIGPPGVGKSAIAEGLAQLLVSDRCPEALRGMSLMEIIPAAAIGGSSSPNELSDLTGNLIAQVRMRNDILFIDDFHVALAYGWPGMGMVGHLTNALRRGQIACVVALSDADYFRAINADPGLERLLEPIRVEELSPEVTVEVLRSSYPKISGGEEPAPEGLLEQVVEATERHLPNRHLPDKALHVLDRVVARARAENSALRVDLIDDVLADMTGLPIGAKGEGARGAVEGLREVLERRVIGQKEAIDAFTVRLGMKLRRLDLRPERPNGVYLFTGPTGVGKTQMARTLAEHLFGSANRLVRLDMSEHSESHHVSQLLGAPPGYVGYEEGSPFLEKVEREPFCVVLLDEMEKAHPAVHRLFLQVFEEGILTTAAGRRTYFSDAIIIMTANLDLRRRQPGFGASDHEAVPLEALDRYFPRELVNRIEAICPFRTLELEDVRRILDEVLLPQWNEARAGDGINLSVDEAVAEKLVAEGYSAALGARELERVVEEKLLAKIPDAIDSGGPVLRARLVGDEIVVEGKKAA